MQQLVRTFIELAMVVVTRWRLLHFFLLQLSTQLFGFTPLKSLETPSRLLTCQWS